MLTTDHSYVQTLVGKDKITDDKAHLRPQSTIFMGYLGTEDAPPLPEKYALHKLLVYGERPKNMRIKASKDLAQAASLIDYLAKNDSELLADTWAGLISRGLGWRSRAIEGLTALKEHYPGVDTSALVV